MGKAPHFRRLMPALAKKMQTVIARMRNLMILMNFCLESLITKVTDNWKAWAPSWTALSLKQRNQQRNPPPWQPNQMWKVTAALITD
jgi:hypothetical protein